jgi:uncharacterized protein YyaL (SSP411 family)
MLGAGGPPNFEGRVIPTLAKTPAELAAKFHLGEPELTKKWAGVRERLRNLREQRKRPLTDAKAIVGWNGLVAVGLYDAFDVFHDPEVARLALQTVDAVVTKCRRPDGRLRHQRIDGASQGDGFADDYAATVLALLAAGRHEPDRQKYIGAAEQFMKTLLDEFWDDGAGGFFYSSRGSQVLILRTKEDYDGAQPSSNSLGALALEELGRTVRNEIYGRKAEELFRGFHQTATENPAGAVYLLLARHRLQQRSSPAQGGTKTPPASGRPQ